MIAAELTPASAAVIGEMTEEHKNFVYSSWLRSYRSAQARRADDYYESQRRMIGHILGHAKVRVATPRDDPHMIYGWVCYGDHGAVHYVYVKELFRKFGLGSRLLEEMGWLPRELRPTHMTDTGEAFLRAKGIKFAATNRDLAYFHELADEEL